MNYKPTIPSSFSRKAICITLVLILGLGLLAGGALADTCHGGPGCLSCAASIHPPFPGTEMDMMAPHGCRQPLNPDSSCSLEAGRGAHEFQGIISSVRPENIDTGCISTATSGSDPSHLGAGFLSLTPYYRSARSSPIFLLNQSLLC